VLSFHGKVLDEETGLPLPGVTFRVLQTGRGTVSGGDGAFLLTLPPGSYTIVVSSVGYLADTLSIALRSSLQQTIKLKPAPVVLQEVLVEAEDPGVGIIRRAIANKKKWMDLLQSYEFDAYTKQILRRDTSIASITESYTRGYWRRDDGLREVIHQRRQTENIPAAQNFTIVGQILNFNEDNIRLGGYTFVGPTAPDAPENYEFKLERIYEWRGVRVYEISLKPKSILKPLFDGTISIADSTYAVMRVNVKPNEAFRFPFIRGLTVNYQQRFSLFDQVFWMPVDISIQAGAELDFPGIAMPPFRLEHRSVLYEYRINPAISDSIFELRRITVDSAANKMDTTFWQANQVLPLTAVEEVAYRTLDSTQTLEKQFRPRGILASVSTVFESPIRFLDWRFNRVEGLFAGGRWKRDSVLTPWTQVVVGAGYGFSDKVWKWDFSLTHRILRRPFLSAGIQAYRRLDHRPDENFFSTFIITLGSLIRKNDYRDYYRASGWNSFIDFQPWRFLSLQLGYRSENQKSVANNTDFSLFSRNLRYRWNPTIHDGDLSSLELSIALRRPRRGRFVTVGGFRPEDPLLRLKVEHSAPGLGSNFDFTRYAFVISFRQPTFLSGLLFAPQLNLRVAGGTARGVLPPQRLFDLESRYTGTGPFGVLRTLRVKEFSGDRYLSASVEHNFRSLPFHWLGLRYLERKQIELIISGALGRTWLTGRTASQLPFVVRTTDGWHKEAGFAISRIFGLLRADFTWKLGKDAGESFFFSLSLADIF